MFIVKLPPECFLYSFRSESPKMVKTSAPTTRSKKATAGRERPPAKKNTSEANWGPSLITHKKLKELEEEGLLPPQDEIK